MKTWLSGKKTYLAALAMAIYGIGYVGYFQHDWTTAYQLLLQAAGLAGLRAGVAKVSVS